MWKPIEPLLPGKATDPGVAAADNRLFVEVVLQRIWTGAPQHDFPPRFGKQDSVYRRLPRWSLSGVFNTLFEAFDFEYLLIDGSILQAHQKASGAKKRGPCRQGIGRSRGGLAGKIIAVTDALGYLVRFVILPGQKHDLVGMPRLMEGLYFGALTADRAFDADWLLKELEERGAEAVISPKKNQRQIRDYDRDMYGQWHQIENFFAKIKGYVCHSVNLSLHCGR